MGKYDPVNCQVGIHIGGLYSWVTDHRFPIALDATLVWASVPPDPTWSYAYTCPIKHAEQALAADQVSVRIFSRECVEFPPVHSLIESAVHNHYN